MACLLLDRLKQLKIEPFHGIGKFKGNLSKINTQAKPNTVYNVGERALAIKVEKSNRLFLRQTFTEQVVLAGYGEDSDKVPAEKKHGNKEESPKLNTGCVWAGRVGDSHPGTRSTRAIQGMARRGTRKREENTGADGKTESRGSDWRWP